MFSTVGKYVLIALFTALLIALVNTVWWFNYERTEEMLDDQLGHRLTAVAQSAAVALGPEMIDSLRYGNLDAYLETIAVLERVRQSDSLSELFILDEQYYYLATTLLEPESTYFLADVNGSVVDLVLFGLVDGPVRTPTYRTGDLFLKSAFAPLEGTDGTVRAVLGVEANVDYFEALAQLRQNLYLATGASLAGGLLLGALFMWWQRRIARAEERLFLTETHAHLGRMVAVVSHELRNPLMIIRGSAERLAKKTGLQEANYVVEEVDRLNEIVTGYLDFARAGGSLLTSDSPGPIDLGQLITSTRQHLLQKYADLPLAWLGDEPPHALSIVGYERSLRQVLLNLLINGVEACREANRPLAVGIEIADRGDTVTLRVVDQGGGITRKQRKQMFTPFYTTKKSGSGLGLYLSRAIVAQMGGTLKIETVPEIGSTVRIRLPKKPKEKP